MEIVHTINALSMNEYSSIKLQTVTTMQSMMDTTQKYNVPMFLTTGEL